MILILRHFRTCCWRKEQAKKQKTQWSNVLNPDHFLAIWNSGSSLLIFYRCTLISNDQWPNYWNLCHRDWSLKEFKEMKKKIKIINYFLLSFCLSDFCCRKKFYGPYFQAPWCYLMKNKIKNKFYTPSLFSNFKFTDAFPINL